MEVADGTMTETLKPETAEQVLDAIKWAAGEGIPLAVRGQGSKDGFGRAVDIPHCLDLTGLSGIKAYEPSELYMTALAATPVAEIEAAFAADPHGIAGILLEPIQGEGGDNHFRPEYLQRLRDLADKHEALLIFDEVQTGIGLTGTMWVFQQLGVTPDIVAFGKKTQVCGIMCTERIDDVPGNVFHVSSRINSTWGGNLVDMVRSARYLRIIEEDNLVEQAATTGAAFLAELQSLAAEFPQMSNIRGRGLMLAFDMPDSASRDALRSGLWDIGLASLACGDRSIRFRPCLTFTTDDVQRAVVLLRQGLAG